MARGKPKAVEWPQEWHGPGGESAWFAEKMYVPLGWTPYYQLRLEVPEPAEKSLPNPAELKTALKEKGIKVDPRWSIVEMERILKEE